MVNEDLKSDLSEGIYNKGSGKAVSKTDFKFYFRVSTRLALTEYNVSLV